MSAFVSVTLGGRRFHTPYCDAQDAGRGLWWSRYGERWLRPEDAAHAGYTACRVCVPPALALPATGQTYGHEPVTEPDLWGRPVVVCARCSEGGARWGWDDRLIRVDWPCMSAVVLGLVILDADRWNTTHSIGTSVLAWPGARWDEPLRTRTRTPAWRLGHGHSYVSVDGRAGGIRLTHVEAL